ncbi:transcription elongation factor SPT6 isoform X1 [Drosophila innubila]|uniref:transcription elongation factor SPT6 isoform X1 n=1 Tax=Drosophila innubila TaxID=198719 RepID=UPI00148B893B|nr:transcription elongation factor SPT6 isoform X1 [Drosophila innubila]
MAEFLDSEAAESEDEEELDVHERKKLKKLKAAVSDSSEEEEDDEERLREELKDLIDDNPIEEDGSENDSDTGSGGDEEGSSAKKRKKHEDDDLDDRLEDDDYDLIEENLGVKVERRKRFKRLRRIHDNESDGEEQHVDEGLAREQIAEQLFDENDDQSIERRSERSIREADAFDDEDSESDADDFIVDDNGRPIAEKKKKRRPIFTDASLQEGQDIFGVDFDYDDFYKPEEDEYEEESEGDEYDEDLLGGDDFRAAKKKKSPKKKATKKTIFDIYEPSELKRGHFTDLDNEIRKTDIPERMQLRQVPVTPVPEGSHELDDEANWIYRFAFCKQTVSEQEKADNREKMRKPPTAVNKIKQTLEFLRNQQLEVPFIAFYRKEYVKPELNIDDLWKVYYYDERWCQLNERKRKLKQLFEKMRQFQLETLCDDPDKPLPDDVRLMLDSDFERLNDVQSMEELKDVHMYFLLNYSHELPKMQTELRRKQLQERREARARKQAANAANSDGEGTAADAIELADEAAEELELAAEEQLKQAPNSSPYAVFRKAGICGFAKHVGLTPEQFAENLRDNYQRNEVNQESLSPTELAKQYLSPRFMTVDEVLHAAKYVVARQLAQEPLLRKTMREVYFDRARLNIRPTKNGMVLIDENSPVYSMKYVAKKPVGDLFGDQFIKLLMAEEEKLLEITFLDEFEGNANANGPPGDYVTEATQLYHLDQFAKNVLEWNSLRAECVQLALKKWVIPDLIKELRATLHEEAQQFVLRSCIAKLYKWLKVAPYKPELPQHHNSEEWSTLRGIRALGLAYDPDQSVAAFCAISSVEGDISDYLRLPSILKRKNSHNSEEKAQKIADLRKLSDFIKMKKPHIIVIGAESRDAQMIQADIREILKELETNEQFPPIEVEIIDNELAKIYANSKKGEADFKEYPPLLKQAASLARKMQDPLVEYSQLCDADDEILCLRYHPLQERVPRELLLEQLSLEFINRTSEVGLDINLMVQNSRTVNLLQYICGLGPRKGQALLKLLKQSNQRLENRTQLVTVCHLGPKVFINCSGFIKIDTSSLGDSTEAYVEVLDGSRVHPETYEWARKMAIDAMEYDDEETNPAGALEEILESPERLKDLDLDAFAVELERQGFGSKSITLYDIRNELSSLYKDYRCAYVKPSAEELFDMLTKETPDSFYVGKCVTAMVTGFTYRRPQGDQLDNANPVRIEESGSWQCPFCHKDDFPELSDVWNHFDDNNCPGQASGVRCRLENGLPGFIHIKNLSDKQVRNPEERVRVAQMIHVRIIKIDIDRFSVDCSSKSADLKDVNNEWRPRRDAFYDFVTEELDNRKVTDAKAKAMKRKTYARRVIAHPSFFNKSYAEVIAMLAEADQGEVALRPSSKSKDHLTATWKVADDIFQHIDVREEGKENEYSLGRSLWIGTEEFEDLDEIIARHINPMAVAARELLQYKYYKPNTAPANVNERDFMEQLLRDEKTKDPKKIHYFFSASKSMPGKFLLSYLPKTKVRHEYVTVMPEGYRFRGQIFDSVSSLLRWFKEHWLDPTAGMMSNSGLSSTPSSNTPTNHGHAHGHGHGMMRPPTTASLSSLSAGGGEGRGDGRGAAGGGGGAFSSAGSISGGTPRSGISSSDIRSSSAYSVTHSIAGYGGGGGGAGGGTGGGASSAHYGSGSTPTFGAHINTPYTPSGQTPFMTPYTPHGTQTPRYGHNVPSPSSQSSSSQRHHYGGTPRYYDMPGAYNNAANLPHHQQHAHHQQQQQQHHAHQQHHQQQHHQQQHHQQQQRAKENLDWQLANDSWARRKPTQQQQQQAPAQQQQQQSGLSMSGFGAGSTPTNEYHTSSGSRNVAAGAAAAAATGGAATGVQQQQQQLKHKWQCLLVSAERASSRMCACLCVCERAKNIHNNLITK